MKKKSVFLVLIAMLVVGLVLIGCPNDPEEEDPMKKFEGQWVNSNADIFIFTGNEMEYKDGYGFARKRKGTFTVTEKEITFIPKEADTWTGYTQGYIINENVLTLATVGGNASGDFTKQVAASKLEGTWKHITAEDFRYIFTKGTFEAIDNNTRKKIGFYTLTDTAITFKCIIDQNGTTDDWTQNYTLNDNEWVLTSDNSHDKGTFIKQ
ncbi:MAG: hypothetical protein LBP76_05725 [Treponema sp.]|jgi:hypothetical protein|nr:hypothetical protein [Treponema sp.]